MKMRKRAHLYAWTARYSRPWQILGRLVERVDRRPIRLPGLPPSLSVRLPESATFIHHDAFSNFQDEFRGKFAFIGEARELGDPPNWAAPGTSLLWRFNLHYFQYLHRLPPPLRARLCQHWISRHPPGTQPAWHPFPTSLRIASWIRTRVDDQVILESLYAQSAFLHRHVERHVDGNHVLENARALIMAGRAFRGHGEAAAWEEHGLELLNEQLPEQVLSDGVHYERSPMYQSLLIWALLDVLGCLPRTHPDRAWIAKFAVDMARALEELLHPDGGIPLLNDSTEEIAPAPSTLLHAVRKEAGSWDPDSGQLSKFAESASGYYVSRGPEAFLVFDAGELGPPHLLAHAHADLFSFELSLLGLRFVTDTGVHDYEEGPSRAYDRGTPAHNCLTVNRFDQAEVWGRFRVARRWSPREVRVERSSSRFTIEGRFDGFGELLGRGISHHRRLILDHSTRSLKVVDDVEGRGQYVVESRFHFHPEVTVVRSDDARSIVLERSGVGVTFASKGGSLEVSETEYHPRFGTTQTRKTVVVSTNRVPAQLEVELSWVRH
ncbi:MAG: alginate lyase family protein [Deltaproteobacteria bacterium]|nr:alginate lyase family protein [Deltaproteobacteria bacterium]